MKSKSETKGNRKEKVLHRKLSKFYSSAPKKDLVADQPALDFSET